MASLSRDAGGRVTIQFVHPRDKKRRTIRAGKLSERDGPALKRKVEDLAAAVGSGLSLDADTQAWLTRIGDELRDKLAAVGLCERSQAAVLGPFLDAYIAGRTDVKIKTVKSFNLARRHLVSHFGADKPLRAITPADCDQFRLALGEQGYALATIGRVVNWARQFFRHALRGKLLLENPFADVDAPAQTNRKRLFFVSPDVAAKVLEACPSQEWRLIFALCRFGGLRCPSELLPLAWAEVDWERERFLVHAPKTERHEGKAERWVPIFPELRSHLVEAFEQATPGAVHVIAHFRQMGVCLHTQLTRIIRRAGLVPWPRLYQNLRASRETELAETFPIHVVAEWLGNSPKTALAHYTQVTEEHFQRAAQGAAPALQKPVQQGAAPNRTDSQEPPEVLSGCGDMRDVAAGCETVPDASEVFL